MKTAILRKSRDFTVRRRHPWVFSGALEREPVAAAPGETVEVLDAGGERLGYGSYSPSSQIRVRMMSFGADAKPPDAEAVASRVAEAVGRRIAVRGQAVARQNLLNYLRVS